MNFKEYQPLAARTSDPSRPHEVALLYAVASLAGEVAEWWKAKTVDEAGDVTWSIAELARVWGVDVEARPGQTIAVDCESMLQRVGVIAEASKKWACHGKPRTAYLGTVGNTLCELLEALSMWHDLTEVYEHNIAKLRERYPDGFVEGGGNRVEWPKGYRVRRDGAGMVDISMAGRGIAIIDDEGWAFLAPPYESGPETGPEGERLACEALRRYLEERGELSAPQMPSGE